eukprot:7878080-Ditylum_brightwellii.AAC.1
MRKSHSDGIISFATTFFGGFSTLCTVDKMVSFELFLHQLIAGITVVTQYGCCMLLANWEKEKGEA